MLLICNTTKFNLTSHAFIRWNYASYFPSFCLPCPSWLCVMARKTKINGCLCLFSTMNIVAVSANFSTARFYQKHCSLLNVPFDKKLLSNLIMCDTYNWSMLLHLLFSTVSVLIRPLKVDKYIWAFHKKTILSRGNSTTTYS